MHRYRLIRSGLIRRYDFPPFRILSIHILPFHILPILRRFLLQGFPLRDFLLHSFLLQDSIVHLLMNLVINHLLITVPSSPTAPARGVAPNCRLTERKRGLARAGGDNQNKRREQHDEKPRAAPPGSREWV